MGTKTFKDLKFKPRYNKRELEGYKKISLRYYEERIDSTQARMKFENGYEVSVLCGKEFNSNGKDTYEVAVMHDGKLCYDTPVTSNVIPYQSADEVTEVMQEIQQLPNRDGEVDSYFDNYNFD